MANQRFDKQLIDRISIRLVEFRAAIHAEIDEMVAEEVSGRLVAKALEEVKQRIEGELKPVRVVEASVDPLPQPEPAPLRPTPQGGV